MIGRKTHILVTGAGGFIGSALCRLLIAQGLKVKGVIRSKKSLLNLPPEVVPSQIDSIGCDTKWDYVLDNVDIVIHLAGIAHRINRTAKDNPADFHAVNVLGTECLAKACVRAGVRRFIYISSIGVNGEKTYKKPFSEDDTPCPVGAYALSKWEAEKVLHKVAGNANIEVVIIRPPLVYGPNAPGNFSRLMSLIDKRIPLPFGNIDNLRSFVYIGNLIDVIFCCIEHPEAKGQTFLVSDGQDISTLNLIKIIAFILNKKPSLFSLHPFILKALCRISGKSDDIEKLIGNLMIDNTKIKSLLAWKAPFSLEEGMKETLKRYKGR